MKDWMDTCVFQEGVKVQRFCLTLVGEARLWYESLRPIAVDWNGLQGWFRQQYPRIGNISEKLFHVWISFHYDKNSEIIDSYITCKGGSRLRRIFWEHQNLSGLSVIRLINTKICIKLYIFWQKIRTKRESGLTAVRLKWDPPVLGT